MRKKNWFKRIVWRLQFRKVYVISVNGEGRCMKCDGGNPDVECADFYCPCRYDQQLKRIRRFEWLYSEYDDFVSDEELNSKNDNYFDKLIKNEKK